MIDTLVCFLVFGTRGINQILNVNVVFVYVLQSFMHLIFKERQRKEGAGGMMITPNEIISTVDDQNKSHLGILFSFLIFKL